MAFRRLVIGLAAALMGLSTAETMHAETLPEPVFSAVHGRVVGWAESRPDWIAVYVEGTGTGWCGLDGASWWVALVETSKATDRVTASHRIGEAMCGNSLAWVRSGRFSDGRHREVAFMLWSTPSIGATTYVYRIEGARLTRLATFPGDKVTLRSGTVTIRYENRGRSPHDTLVDRYRFTGGRYRLLKT